MNYAIILSGGMGSRTGLDLPKQYYEVSGKPIIQYVIDQIEECDFIDKYIIVAAEEWQQFIADSMSRRNRHGSSRFWAYAAPGENRQLSIYNGLLKLKNLISEISDNDKVIIQDAARPKTSVELYRSCLDFADEYDGAMPVLPMKDTVYLSEDGNRVKSLLNRSQIFAGQSPEAFLFAKYLSANEALLPDSILQINGSTESAIMAGMKIQMIDGDENNYKITSANDVIKFESES